jgi:hypothetical protein
MFFFIALQFAALSYLGAETVGGKLPLRWAVRFYMKWFMVTGGIALPLCMFF